jgi:hypothetical protein
MPDQTLGSRAPGNVWRLTPTGRWIIGGTVIAIAALALFALLFSVAWQE